MSDIMLKKFDASNLTRPWIDAALVRPDWVQNTARDPKLTWLDKNENLDVELLAHNKAILAELDPLVLATYPDSGSVYRKLAEFEDVSPQCLRLAPGSDGVIRAVFDTFVAPGEPVVYVNPTFAMYPVYCRMFGATGIPIDYSKGADGPELSTATLIHALRAAKPKLFCLPNPNSPTGTLIDLEALRLILRECLELNTIALIDEAYHPFTDTTAKELLSEFPNLMVARTFAKAWGLAGLRIGYSISSPTVAMLLHKVRPMYEVSTLAVAFIERALDGFAAVKASVQRINDAKDRFTRAMAEFGFPCPKTNGNFQLVAFGKHGPVIHRRLKASVLYREHFSDPCLVDYTRFSIAPWPQMVAVVDHIHQAIQQDK